METEIRPVDKENLSDILALHVSRNQVGFVESTDECLSDAKHYKNYRPVGLYSDDVLVGFAMYGQFPDEGGRVWMDRLLIDERYQGHGLGRIFVRKLIDYLQQQYCCDKIYLSVFPENSVAISLYESFGFKFSGEKDYGGEEIMVLDLE